MAVENVKNMICQDIMFNLYVFTIRSIFTIMAKIGRLKGYFNVQEN